MTVIHPSVDSGVKEGFGQLWPADPWSASAKGQARQSESARQGRRRHHSLRLHPKGWEAGRGRPLPSSPVVPRANVTVLEMAQASHHRYRGDDSAARLQGLRQHMYGRIENKAHPFYGRLHPSERSRKPAPQLRDLRAICVLG